MLCTIQKKDTIYINYLIINVIFQTLLTFGYYFYKLVAYT